MAEGAEAARWCALNALSVLRAELGDLDRIERVLSVLGFVACTPGFDQQAAVVDGASRLLVDVLGPAGRHTRSPSASRRCPGAARSRSRSPSPSAPDPATPTHTQPRPPNR